MNNKFEDLFKIFDIENDWKEFYENFCACEDIDEDSFLSLIKQTHEFFMPTCDEKSIPKSLIYILLNIQEFATDKLFIDSECEAYKYIANGLLQAIICDINNERYKKGEFDVEINNRLFNFDVNKPYIKEILKEASKISSEY